MHIWHMLSRLGHSYIHFLGFSHLFSFIFFFRGSSISKILCMFKCIATIPTTLVIVSQYLHFYYFLLWLEQYSHSSYICKSSELSLQTAATCWLLLLLLPFTTPCFPPRSLFEMPLICEINSTFKCADLLSHFWAPLNFNKGILKKHNEISVCQLPLQVLTSLFYHHLSASKLIKTQYV